MKGVAEETAWAQRTEGACGLSYLQAGGKELERLLPSWDQRRQEELGV